MRDEQVTLLATSGTTADRLQVIWEWSWWDPQEREAMRLNARIAAAMRARRVPRSRADDAGLRRAARATSAARRAAERSIDGILFFNESADPTHWTDGECERMLREWCEFAPRGVEADPAYLAIIARAALKRGMRLPSPEFITLTYETTTRAMRARHRARVRRAAVPALRRHRGRRAVHGVRARPAASERAPQPRRSRAAARRRRGSARVLVTTLGRAWMPLLRYDIGDVVRVAESRDCACGLSSDGPLLERVEGRHSDCTDVGGETVTPLLLDDAIHAALGPDVDARAVAARRRHACSSSIRSDGDSAARAAAAVGALLRAPDSRRARRGHRARGFGQVPARQALMRAVGLSAARARLRRRAVHLSRQRLDDAEAARGHRRGRRATTKRSAPTCIAASIRSRKRPPRSTSARAIASPR